ncbi:unnamed protein product [Cylicocyclus nassatus]|uniref:Uncharacterized protein n=1 Tax=Cylicocyclus nassatus TaxID=53992 RepID=A0AA36M1V1_CYLNA|nr:unnamed protein product [Cylicocyclus nassatus]
MVSQRRSTQSRKGKEANPSTPETNIPSSDILSSSQKDDEGLGGTTFRYSPTISFSSSFFIEQVATVFLSRKLSSSTESIAKESRYSAAMWS